MIQTRKNQYWLDESGNQIPFNRLTHLEVKQEADIARLIKEAALINGRLKAFKAHIATVCNNLVREFMLTKKVDSIGKGNVTLYNFDRSIKIQLDINDRIEFDDLTMKACKEKFDEFLNANIDEKQDFVKEMVNNAFSTSRGKLDSKKVMSLLKFETRIKDTTFQDALTLLKESIRRPDSKSYYRVWVKDESGAFQNIDLNFSSI
ncbi:MAG: DUF3164 family protein [Bacteroidota bacterium]